MSEHNANRNLLLNTASTTTIDGVTFTVNADKSVTITGSQNNPSQHTKLVLGKFTANRSDLVLDSGIAASASANIFINTQDGVTTTRNLGHATITGTDLNTERDYQILVIAGTSNINTTIKPMICTQADWDATQEYEVSGGLPNYDLTYLEAQDRAALAEVVDSGAKNKLQYDLTSLKAKNTNGTWNNNAYTIGGITYTLNSDMSISISGTRSSEGNAILNLADYTAVSGDLMSQGTIGVQNVFFYARGGSSSCNTIGYTNIESVDIGVNRTYALAVTAVAGTAVNQRYYPMICTKAAFGVSQKFVPYRKPYADALSVLDKRAPKGTDGTISSGSMDNLDSGCVLCNPNVTGGPQQAFCYVRTRIYDSNCTLQQVFYPVDNTAYQRCKWAGTWSEWKQFVS